SMHKEAASHYVMYILNTNVQKHDAAKQFKSTADALLEPMRKQRMITPITGSEYAPSSSDAGNGEVPPFDDSFFEGMY
ncbi:MAG: hypothetical protein ACPGVG_06155, partial [Mycobacterium sp.]